MNIYPSLLAKTQKELTKRLAKVQNVNKEFHLDIMDGRFVPNKSLWFNYKLPKKNTYHAHLMITNPKRWIEKNYAKVSSIAFHYESCKDKEEAKKIIEQIKTKKRRVGLAINPGTRLKNILTLIPSLDHVLLMSVQPGKYGSTFQRNTIRRINYLRKKYPRLKIIVDGSINEKTYSNVEKAGANEVVIGSYLQNTENTKKAIKTLQKGGTKT